MRYFLRLSYNGRAFNGWQVQPNARTVQGDLEHVLSMVFNGQIRVMGCGRTDTGVHASKFYAHFDTDKEIPSEFVFRLNRLMPGDVAIQEMIEVEGDAHARFDAFEREYQYFIHTKKDPFKAGMSTYYPRFEIDDELIQQAVELLPGYSDFKPLCKMSEDFKTTICEVYSASWERTEEGGALFTIRANRFLRNMIRRIVAVLVNIGNGKTSLDEFKEVMDSKGEFKIIELAPPDGLYLTDVRYPYLKD